MHNREKEKSMAKEIKSHIRIFIYIVATLAQIPLRSFIDDNVHSFFGVTVLIYVVIVDIFLVIGVPINIIRILKTWYSESYTEKYVKGTHYETTVKNDGTFVTKEVTEYGGGHQNNGPFLILLFFLSPIWWIPRFLYSMVYLVIHYENIKKHSGK